MSLVEPTLLSLARAAIISGLALAVLLIGGPGVRATPHESRRRIFLGAIAALLTPGFVVGFMFFPAATKSALQREFFYCSLVWIRYAPLALLVVWLSPPAISASGVHCLTLSGRFSPLRRFRAELRGWGHGVWLGTGIVFLFAFQEFELATTWNMRAWSVALFDAQVGGMRLSETLKLALFPCAILIVLIATLASIARTESDPVVEDSALTRRAKFGTLSGIVALLFVTAVFVGLPYLGTRAFRRGDLFASLAPWREMGAGALLSAASSAAAWMVAGWMMRRGGWRMALAIPGLFGTLVCGLVVLALSELLPSPLVGSALPAIAALGLSLVPFALLMQFGIRHAASRTSLHLARQAGARNADWQLVGWPQFFSLLLLFGLGYGDFTINSLLAPPEFTSASVRLLNLLHYGQSSSLIIMFIIAFAFVWAVALLTILAARFYPRRRVR